jgi:hypothetical protein
MCIRVIAAAHKRKSARRVPDDARHHYGRTGGRLWGNGGRSADRVRSKFTAVAAADVH